MPEPPFFMCEQYMLIHHDHKPLLMRLSDQTGSPRDPAAPISNQFGGVRVEFSADCPKWVTRWRFPNNAHITYEESDEDWCRYFNIGHEITTNEPVFWMIGGQPRYDITKHIEALYRFMGIPASMFNNPDPRVSATNFNTGGRFYALAID